MTKANSLADRGMKHATNMASLALSLKDNPGNLRRDAVLQELELVRKYLEEVGSFARQTDNNRRMR